MVKGRRDGHRPSRVKSLGYGEPCETNGALIAAESRAPVTTDGATLLGSPDNHRLDPIGNPDKCWRRRIRLASPPAALP